MIQGVWYVLLPVYMYYELKSHYKITSIMYKLFKVEKSDNIII